MNDDAVIPYLRERLAYDPAEGLFTRTRTTRACNQGDAAGFINMQGYVVLAVDQLEFLAHRVAVAFQTGAFPPPNTHVDHINGDKSDNRYVNLRVVSPSVNGFNRKNLNKNNQSGATGVFEKRPGRFMAYVGSQKSRRYLGTYGSFDEAVAARSASVTLPKV